VLRGGLNSRTSFGIFFFFLPPMTALPLSLTSSTVGVMGPHSQLGCKRNLDHIGSLR